MECPDLESSYLWEDPEVVAHLRQCEHCQPHLEWLTALQERVVQEENQQSALPDGFLQRLRGHLDQLDQAPVVQLPPKNYRWVRGLALAACLALTCLTLLWPGSSQASGLEVDMLSHHQTCNEIPNTPGRRQHFQQWADAHQGMHIPVPFEASAGLQELERRNCAVSQGCRGPHLIMKSQQGQLVSLYALPRKEMGRLPALPDQPRTSRQGDFAVVVWQKGDWVFGVVARQPPDQVLHWINPALGQNSLQEIARALHLQPV